MRRTDREVKDINEITQILDTAKILRLGLFDGEYPYVVPLHYGYELTDGVLTFYIHGAKEGHKIDLINANPAACVELDCNVELISAGDVACAYGSTFSSVIARGKAELVTDSEEKVHGLKVLMLHQTGREFEMNEKMSAAVAVIKVTSTDFTAKARKK
jgi:nitroimidazol reductase NimA-like FMN-containing flavoprotein (pyridoxamine 5'-phosphate oxidase superfamily)